MANQYPDRILELRDPNKHLNMYILPASSKRWPSFYPTKQAEVTDRNVFFHRVSQTHTLRFNATVDLLRAGKRVVATGVEGIGKSAELNAYLMLFLANVGKEGWPTEVWYRFEEILLKFCLIRNKPTVFFSKPVNLSLLWNKTDDYEGKPIDAKPVLFLELVEHEVNPRSCIPTLLHLSNRDVYDRTKEFDKGGARYLLIDPPTCDELCQMACWEADFGAKSVFKGMDRADIIKLVTERVTLVGPIPRTVFQTHGEFKSSVADLDKNIDDFVLAR